MTDAEPTIGAGGEAALAASRTRFDRVLMHWASDLLSLRSRGLDVPSRRRLVSERATLVVGEAAAPGVG